MCKAQLRVLSTQWTENTAMRLSNIYYARFILIPTESDMTEAIDGIIMCGRAPGSVAIVSEVIKCGKSV